MDQKEFRVGDMVDVRLCVLMTASAGLGVQMGDAPMLLRHVWITGHQAVIRRGDFVRERGSNALGGPRTGRVVTFYDAGGNELPEGGQYVLVLPAEPAMGRFEGPKVYRSEDLERLPFGDWPKSPGST